jgi:hypothetical protein
MAARQVVKPWRLHKVATRDFVSRSETTRSKSRTWDLSQLVREGLQRGRISDISAAVLSISIRSCRAVSGATRVLRCVASHDFISRSETTRSKSRTRDLSRLVREGLQQGRISDSSAAVSSISIWSRRAVSGATRVSQ